MLAIKWFSGVTYINFLSHTVSLEIKTRGWLIIVPRNIARKQKIYFLKAPKIKTNEY